MGFYFYSSGKPNLKFLTAQTLVLALLLINAYDYKLLRIKD